MIEGFLASLDYALPPGGGLTPFLLLTLAIGGGAAWRTGQAVAEGWQPVWPVLPYTAIIAAAVRFLHYALFGATLVSLPSFLVDFTLLAVIALVAYRIRRARHMTEQYGWIFERSGPLTWRDRP
jgi:hypothetical protein